MALKPATALAKALLAAGTSTSKATSVKAIVDAVGDHMDTLQAGATGSAGIFKLNRPAMIGMLMSQSPTTSTSWAQKFAKAWAAGVSGAAITPGTVLNPAWIGTGATDGVTPGIGAAAITNVSAGESLLAAKLLVMKITAKEPIEMAEAIQAATTTLMFLNIGLSAPPAMAPVPIPAKTQ